MVLNIVVYLTVIFIGASGHCARLTWFSTPAMNSIGPSPPSEKMRYGTESTITELFWVVNVLRKVEVFLCMFVLRNMDDIQLVRNAIDKPPFPVAPLRRKQPIELLLPCTHDLIGTQTIALLQSEGNSARDSSKS